MCVMRVKVDMRFHSVRSGSVEVELDSALEAAHHRKESFKIESYVMRRSLGLHARCRLLNVLAFCFFSPLSFCT